MSLRCHYIGTLGIIVLAKKRGIITSVRESLEKLQKAGLWLSESLVNETCQKAGEG
jgi:predicted nucleic acid-binding protein